MTAPGFPETPGIPDANDRWDALAARITAAARTSGNGLYWVGTARVGWFAAVVLIATGIVTSLSSPDNRDPASSSVQWTEMLTPADRVGQAIVASDRPPEIGTLLLGVPPSDVKK